MRTLGIMTGSACVLLSSLFVAPAGSPARAADVMPSYFDEIVGTQAASPAEVGTKNVLQLNTTMFELYGDAGQVFKKNILAQHPVILGLFSGAAEHSPSIVPEWRRSTDHRYRSPISCSSRSA